MRSVDIKRTLIGLTVAVVLTGAARAQTVAGDWHGALATPVGELRTVVKIKPAGAGFEGVLLSPDQSATTRPLADIKLDGQTLTFGMAGTQARFDGRWDAGARTWAGTWTQGGRPFPLTLLPGDLPKGPVVAGLDGDWAGELANGGLKIRVILHVRTGAYGTIAALDSPDQLVTGLPAALTRDGSKVAFTVKAVGLSYAGALSADGRTLTGASTQGERSTPLVLTHREPVVATGPAARPQTPKPPFPYTALEVAFDSAPGVKLAGTLTLPPGERPFPAVIMITGSGPQDRDETIVGHKPFAVIADDLTRRGIAVLRYDDRGVARSTGDFSKAGIEDFAADATAALNWLSAQPRIDARRIGLLGHSEGGVIAPMVASRDRRVASVILIAAPGVPLTKVLSAQRAALAPHMGLNAENAAKSQAMFDHAMAAMVGAASDEEAKARAAAVFLAEGKAFGVNETNATNAAATISSGWFRGLLAYDPRVALTKVTVPVLAVNGAKDLQVLSGQNLPAIKAATSANRDVTTVELPGLNHLLQTATTGAAGEYADIAETVAPSALKVIGDWIVGHTRGPL
jgi:alpha-beta hydrolase superfamily lysophospholipase